MGLRKSVRPLTAEERQLGLNPDLYSKKIFNSGDHIGKGVVHDKAMASEIERMRAEQAMIAEQEAMLGTKAGMNRAMTAEELEDQKKDMLRKAMGLTEEDFGPTEEEEEQAAKLGFKLKPIGLDALSIEDLDQIYKEPNGGKSWK